VRAYESGKAAPRQGGILDGALAPSWEMRVDSVRSLVFPDNPNKSSSRVSALDPRGKRMVLVERTVPWEERCDEHTSGRALVRM